MANDPEHISTKSEPRRTPAPFEEGWQPLARLRAEMDRMLEDFVAGMPLFANRSRETSPFRPFEALAGSLPAVDMVEKDNAYELTAELPGLSEDDVEVTLSDGVLTIRGEKRQETDKKSAGYHLSERRYGSFRRSFRLPEDVDQDEVDASFGNGLLRLTLHKNPAAAKKQKKIKIKSA